MPTKPTTLDLFATQTNYTTGPAGLIGTLTKIAPPGAEITEGSKANQAAFAQWENYLKNQWTVWLDWVRLGVNTPDEDAHIIETDANGTATISGIAAGNRNTGTQNGILVHPNNSGGTAGLLSISKYNKPGTLCQSEINFVPAIWVQGAYIGNAQAALYVQAEADLGGGKGEGRAIEARGGVKNEPAVFADFANRASGGGTGPAFQGRGGDGNDATGTPGGSGIYAEGGAADGATRGGPGVYALTQDDESPAINVDKTQAGAQAAGVRITSKNFAYGIDALHTSGKVPVARLEGNRADATPGESGTPLVMVPQDVTPHLAYRQQFPGAMWVFTASGRYRPAMVLDDDDSSYLTYSKNPNCGLFFRQNSAVTATSDNTWTGVGPILSFTTHGEIPVIQSDVLITIRFSKHRDGLGSAIPDQGGYQLRISDGGGVIQTWSFDLPTSAGAAGTIITTDSHRSIEYTAPAGNTNFNIEHTKLNSADATTVTITDITIDIRPMQRY